jgi:hypothetical protein
MIAYEFYRFAEVGPALDQEAIMAIDDDQARSFGELILLCSDDTACIEIHPPLGPVITLRRESLCS